MPDDFQMPEEIPSRLDRIESRLDQLENLIREIGSALASSFDVQKAAGPVIHDLRDQVGGIINALQTHVDFQRAMVDEYSRHLKEDHSVKRDPEDWWKRGEREED